MSLSITRIRGGTPNTAITCINGSLKVTRNIERGHRAAMQTYDDVQEWDEIIIKDVADNTVFAGIVNSVDIEFSSGKVKKYVELKTYRKLFDREMVAKSYQNMLFGDIIKDIIDDFTSGFTYSGVQDGILIESISFNYERPSNCLKILCAAIGYTWTIGFDRDVSAFPRAGGEVVTITDTSNDFRDLTVKPDITGLFNVAIVRGGTYLSTTQTISYQGDGETTVFFTPHKPREVAVKVNGVAKSIVPKFGDQAPSTDFVMTYQEKAIENGTFATLGSSDVISIDFKFDVDLRLRYQDEESIAALETLLGAGNGEFVDVIEDDTIDSRNLALETAKAHIDARKNPRITGQFKTHVTTFAEGQTINIEYGAFSRSAVIIEVQHRHIAGDLFDYTVKFETVLFGFEDFLRKLLQRGKIAINEGEVVELIYNFKDTIVMQESWAATVDGHRYSDTFVADDTAHSALAFPISYVLAEYDNTKIPVVDSLANATGTGWSSEYGGATITNEAGAMRLASSGYATSLVNQDATDGRNGVLRVRIVQNNGLGQLQFRGLDSNNFLIAWFDGSIFRISKRESGSLTQLVAVSIATPTDGYTIEVEMNGQSIIARAFNASMVLLKEIEWTDTVTSSAWVKNGMGANSSALFANFLFQDNKYPFILGYSELA